MTTVDTFLTQLKKLGFDAYQGHIDKKDLKVLKSLAEAVISPNFITENQARLLHKILVKHVSLFSIVNPDIDLILTNNSWSRSFRVIDQVRKMYIDKVDNTITLEFTHNFSLRKVLSNLTKDVDSSNNFVNTKSHKFLLTEKNIVSLVTALKPYRFDIDPKIMEFYEIIKNFKISETLAQYTFGKNLGVQLKNALENELGSLENVSHEKILDRKLRYHYFTEKTSKNLKNSENLRDLLIFRSNPKVWIDSNKFSLSGIFQELKNLERLPVLLVFDSWNDDSCMENLKIFAESMEKSGISGPVGIYFRLENNETGITFNQAVKTLNFNSHLNDQTLVAGVQSGKLPKFFLKDCNWTPRSVIVLGTTLRHSKTAVYSNRCDLIISYSDKESIIENTITPWRR